MPLGRALPPENAFNCRTVGAGVFCGVSAKQLFCSTDILRKRRSRAGIQRLRALVVPSIVEIDCTRRVFYGTGPKSIAIVKEVWMEPRKERDKRQWWAVQDSNLRPSRC